MWSRSGSRRSGTTWKPRYDLEAIVARLRDTAESWVPRYFPNGRRVGDDWRLANINGDPPRKQGSCIITLKGPHAGDWYEHDGNTGGGPLRVCERMPIRHDLGGETPVFPMGVLSQVRLIYKLLVLWGRPPN